MKAIRLRTEYLKNPIGIDLQQPRLMWNAEGGTRQTAYEIVTEKWKSGKVESASMRASYPIVLKSRESFSHIRFLGAEPAIAETYYEKKSMRDRKARRAYRQTKRAADAINELYILDIMREGIKNGDPRLR